MSTKAAIGILNSEGTIRGICCNYDGYLQGVGSTLNKCYNTVGLADELISIGNITKLQDDAEATKIASLNRGTMSKKSMRFNNVDDFERYYSVADYYYLFDKTCWTYRTAMSENHSYEFLEMTLNNLK